MAPTLYRLALLLLPPGFRRQYGAALAEEAAARLREAGGGRRRIAVLARLGTDLGVSVPREWGDVLVQGAKNGLGGGTMADLKWALRGLRRSPGFALAVVLMLGLGIGVSTVAVGLADAYLLKSLPYPDADRLAVLWPTENWSNEMMDLARSGLHDVRGIAGRGGTRMILDEGGEPEEVFVAAATTNLFDVMGVHPALGRGFVASDGAPGAPPVAILSHRVWAERFGSDPGVVGRSIALGGDGAPRHTVIGVMPADYLPVEGTGVAAWVPVNVDPTANSYKSSYFMTAVARLKSDASPEQLDREIKAWAPRMSEADPGWFTKERIRHASAVPIGRWSTQGERAPVLVALVAALVVLLVACANVTNLVVARTVGRERELSVRAALGAGRVRTARAVGVEVAVLALLGTVVGFGLAGGAVRVLETRFAGALPDWGLSMDTRWVAMAVALSVVAALAAGLIPALQAARRDPAAAMAAGRGALTRRRVTRLQEGLSAAQLALAAAGVAAMGLLGRSLEHLGDVDPGVHAGSAITFRTTAPPDAYPGSADVERFYRDARAALLAVPGVDVAGFSSRLPLSGGESEITVDPEGTVLPPGTPWPVVWDRWVTPGYLDALGTHLVEGHIPTADEDRDGEPALVVVNRAAAYRFWPGQSAIGKRVYRDSDHKGVTLTVAGVVDDVIEEGQTGPMLPGLYIPERVDPHRTMCAVVRAEGDPASLVPRLRSAIHSVSAGAPVSRVETLASILAGGLRPARTLAILAALAGVVTLLLGTLGTYAVVSQGVARRIREIGVRAALGADRGRLVHGEMSRATRIVVAGLAGGLVLAGVTGRLLEGVLYGVGPFDPASVAAALGLLAGVGYLAAYLPARRAARVEPVEVMRAE